MLGSLAELPIGMSKKMLVLIISPVVWVTPMLVADMHVHILWPWHVSQHLDTVHVIDMDVVRERKDLGVLGVRVKAMSTLVLLPG